MEKAKKYDYSVHLSGTGHVADLYGITPAKAVERLVEIGRSLMKTDGEVVEEKLLAIAKNQPQSNSMDLMVRLTRFNGRVEISALIGEEYFLENMSTVEK